MYGITRIAQLSMPNKEHLHGRDSVQENIPDEHIPDARNMLGAYYLGIFFLDMPRNISSLNAKSPAFPID